MHPQPPVSGRPSRASAGHGRSGLSTTPLLVLLLIISLLGGGRLARAWYPQDAPSDVLLETRPQVTGDTVRVYGPRRFEVVRGGGALHVEDLRIDRRPGARYRVVIQNGADDGTARVERGSLILNDREILSPEERMRGDETSFDDLELRDLNELVLDLSGDAGSYVMLTVYQVSSPTTTIFGPVELIRTTGAPDEGSWSFDVPGGVAAPFTLWINNGFSDGSSRATAAWVELNGMEVFGTEDFGQAVGYLEADVALQDSANVLHLTIAGKKGSRLEAFITAVVSDTTAPVVTITAPEQGLVTSADSVLVLGTAVDEGVVTVNVNGIVAQVVDDSLFSATVPLPLEGLNVITATATDGAGNEAVATATVTRDHTTPVLTILQPSDSLITNVSPTPLVGSANDVNGSEVAVHGVPVPTDTTGAFADSVALVEGPNVLTVTATDPAGNQTVEIRTVILDTQAPTLVVTSPVDSLVTSDASVVISGTVADASMVTVVANGTTLPVDQSGTFSGSVPLVEGPNTITITATDQGVNQSSVVRTVLLDQSAPVLSVTAPPDALVTDTAVVTVTGTVTDASPVTVDVNGIPLPVDGAGLFGGDVLLSDGANILTITATDRAGNSAQAVRIVTLDSVAPVVAVTSPQNGATTQADSIDVVGSVEDLTATTVAVNGLAVSVDTLQAFSLRIALALGTNVISVVATDAAGNQSTVTVQVEQTSPLPPDPQTVAPPLNPTVTSNIATATQFLYSGQDPIQTGVAPGTIEPKRVSVVRGHVRTRAGDPLGGVVVRVVGHPELGQTLSRADGGYDLVVNGGRPVSLDFSHAGYLSAQRQVDAQWQDYRVLDEVRLVPLDTAVNVIDFSAPVELARGSVETDGAGSRQATLLFRQGTQAAMILADGSSVPISSASVRATEYTVGPNGSKTMPAELPPATEYTYAVELSVDEALAAGARRVDFSAPVAMYVENFLGLPVGHAMPLGYYDRERAVWVAEEDGVILRVVGVTAGVAELDITGDGVAESSATLAGELGIDATELETVGALYAVGQSLWRVQVSHFTTYDLNVPAARRKACTEEGKCPPPNPDPCYGAGCASNDDAEPGEDADGDGEPDADSSDRDEGEEQEDTCEGAAGSYVVCQNQTLGERLAITGTPYSLNYLSSRVPGWGPGRRLEVPIRVDSVGSSGQPLVRPEFVVVDLEVAGVAYSDTLEAATQTYVFNWDGRDAYGRFVLGRQRVQVRIGFVYLASYLTSKRLTGGRSFGQPVGDSAVVTDPNDPSRRFTQSSEWEGSIGYPFAVSAEGDALQFGGWSINVHHVYDPATSTLYMGTGEQSSNRDVPLRINTFAGNGNNDFDGDTSDGQAAAGSPIYQPWSVLPGPDGAVYIGQGDGRIRKVDASGVISTFAFNGTPSFYEGAPVQYYGMSRARDMAWGPDGSLYLVSDATHRAHKVTPDGRVFTVAGFPEDSIAGTTHIGYAGDGGPAVSTNTKLNRPLGIAVAADGTIYIADTGNHVVRRVGTDGIISTYASLTNLIDVALTPDGDLIMLSTSGNVVRKSVDGVQTTVMTSGIEQSGYPSGLQGTNLPRALAVAPDGSIYFVQGLNNVVPSTLRVRVIQPNGIVRSVAGSGVYGDFGDGGPALRAGFGTSWGIGVGPDGTVYLADSEFIRIRSIEPPLEGFSGGDIAVASPDGSEVFRFDAEGKHLETFDAVTGVLTYAFGYDVDGFLTSITDRNGLATTFTRSGGSITVTGPYGHATALTEAGDGYLASVEAPEARVHTFTYHAGGLMAQQVGPRADTSSYTYDPDGRIVQARDAGGGVRTWGRGVVGGSFTVTAVSPLNRTTQYEVRRSSTGAVTSVVTDPTGLESASRREANGGNIRTAPDGTVVGASDVTELAADVSGSRTDTTTISLPSGLSSTIIRTRSRVVAEHGDPLPIKRQVESVRRPGTPGAWVTETVADSSLVRRSTPEGRSTLVQLGSRGELVEQNLPGVAAVNYFYDAQGRLSSLTQGARAWQYAYDAGGRLATATDPLTRSTQFFYDAADRLTRQVLPDGREVAYAYDANGNLTSVTPSGRPAHTFQYDAVNLATEYRPPTVGATDPATRYTYDVDRALTRVQRPDRIAVDFTYDAGGRAGQVTFPGGLLEYGYDPVTGNLTGINGPYGGALSMAYDGPLLTGIQWIGEVAGSVGAAYDNDFRVSVLSVNGADPVTFDYDRDGLLLQAGALSAVRDAASGRLTGTTLGSLTSTQSYNGFGELSALTWTHGTTPLLATSYTRDALGRIETKTELVGTETTTWSYGYDLAGRLTQVDRDGAPEQAYAYDANGNRTSFTDASSVITATYDAQDRLLTYGGNSYTYTANGELTAKIQGVDTTRYTYDVLGNLLAVDLPDGTGVHYLVDAMGRRVGRKVNGVLDRGWLYQDGLNPIAELGGSGAVVGRFVYGTRASVPDYMVKGGVTYRIVPDDLGSVRMVVDVVTGTVVQELVYDAWGRVLVDTNPGFQPFGYAGGVYDPATGLVRFGARDYDAAVGRWTSMDPLGFAGRSANLYAYVTEDPINRMDRDGLQEVMVIETPMGPFPIPVPPLPITPGDLKLSDLGHLLDPALDFNNDVRELAGAMCLLQVERIKADWKKVLTSLVGFFWHETMDEVKIEPPEPPRREQMGPPPPKRLPEWLRRLLDGGGSD